MAVFSDVQFATVNTNATDTTIVAALTTGKIRVVAMVIVAAGAVVAQLQSDTAGTTLTGPMTMATGVPIELSFNPRGWCETAATKLLNLHLGGAVQVSGVIAYVQVDN